MNLNINDDRSFDPATVATIAHELRELPVDQFAILATEDQVYVQTFRQDEASYLFEYRDGSEETHFETVEPETDIERIVSAFTRYARGDESWRDEWEWKRLEF